MTEEEITFLAEMLERMGTQEFSEGLGKAIEEAWPEMHPRYGIEQVIKELKQQIPA